MTMKILLMNGLKSKRGVCAVLNVGAMLVHIPLNLHPTCIADHRTQLMLQ